MPKLAANLSWLYQDIPLMQRFAAAASHGMKEAQARLDQLAGSGGTVRLMQPAPRAQTAVTAGGSLRPAQP